MFHYLLLLAASAAPPPTTVNGEILGKPEDFMTEGPARVCVGRTSIDLAKGETAFANYLGIHFATLRVIGPGGTFLVTVSGMWKKPRRAELLQDSSGRNIALEMDRGRPIYLIYPPRSRTGGDRPLVKVAGDALGRLRDAAILDRILIHRERPADCRRHFEYGWDFS